ncbi:hypothetical protein M413DRAFT_448653 [Hebeloma cylindrosporum]|uniref:Uncharacterized protein n=1 Tax=Hebeloma cylindrosporum TaxID=76867 RepID=A0A0C3C0F2_HEBCY|nr:hypothetical protein M413DRAFT_448653 [Hebeloma cylindrosporum h7]
MKPNERVLAFHYWHVRGHQVWKTSFDTNVRTPSRSQSRGKLKPFRKLPPLTARAANKCNPED